MRLSLLPDCSSPSESLLDSSDSTLERWSHAWPKGNPDARIVQEYLVGRRHGLLDISGRHRTDSAPSPDTDDAGETEADVSGRRTIVINDADGALSMVSALVASEAEDTVVFVVHDSAAAAAATTRAWESLPEELRARMRLAPSLDEALQEAGKQPGVSLNVLIQAPKHVAVLRDSLRMVEAQADEVIVVGRDKHMSPSFNRLLAEGYDRVDVSPGRAKSRLLIASSPKKHSIPAAAIDSAGQLIPAHSPAQSPVKGVPEIEVYAFSGTFGGAAPDAGSMLLVRTLAAHMKSGEVSSSVQRVLDVGCGNGWLLAATGALVPDAELWGVDDSRAAVESSGLTVASVRPGESAVKLHHVDATKHLPWQDAREVAAGGFDLVTLNPPFHEGTTVTTDIAHTLIERSVDLLAPGGRLVIVHNSHLRYRSHLNHRLEGVRQWARDRRFTVMSGVKAL